MLKIYIVNEREVGLVHSHGKLLLILVGLFFGAAILFGACS